MPGSAPAEITPPILHRTLDAADRAQAAIACPEEFAVFLRLSSVAVLICCRRESRIVGANDRFLRLLGRDRSEVIGRAVGDLGLTLDGDPPTEIQMDITAASGERRSVAATADIIEADGEEWVVGQFREMPVRRAIEARLVASQDHLRALLNATSVGFVVHDDTGAIVSWNEATERMLGRTGDRLQGQTWRSAPWRIVREDGRSVDAADHPVLATLRTGRPCINELIGIHQSSGELVWLNVDTRPLLDDAGQILIGVVATFLDVTEWRARDQALRDRDARFRLALTAGTLATWEWDVETGALLTDGFEHLAGLTEGEFDGSYESYVRLIHPDDRERVRSSDRDHVLHPGDFSLEYRVVRPDGEVRWLAERGRTIRRREDGTAERVAGATVDVTERKRIEGSLRESEARFRGAFDYAAIGVALTDLDGRFLAVNQALRDLLGDTDGVLEGTSLAEVTHRDDLAQNAALWDLLLSGESPMVQAERRFRHQDGRVVWGLLSISLIRDDEGDPHSLICQIVDVTRTREIERHKSEFVATVSHELRTPLTSVSGYVDLLLDDAAGELPDAAMAFLRIIQSNARRLVSLINDLLDISRIESGRLELRCADVDLTRAVRDFAVSFQPQLRAKEQRLRLDLAGDIPLVWADAERVTQILANLLSNAHKYSPVGGEIAIVVRRDPLGARVSVIDRGIGMAGEEQARLFEKFYRVANSVSAPEAGTGLGLAITRSLVELHGGSISVRSTPGQGSTFDFNLPAAELVTYHEREPSLSDADRKTMGRLLVVENELDVAELLTRVLTRDGYEVSHAGTAAAALAAIASNQPDLITLDPRLPDAHGWDLVERLRDLLGNDLPPILIVSVLTADGTSDEEGGVDHLANPIQAGELPHLVERLLGRRAVQERATLDPAGINDLGAGS